MAKLTSRERDGRWIIRRSNTTICTTSSHANAPRIMRAIIGAAT